MFLTLLFAVLFFNKKKSYNDIINTINGEPELFEIDNILNSLHNPEYYNNYWNKVHKELFYLLLKSFIIIICMYMDITCIEYVYLSE